LSTLRVQSPTTSVGSRPLYVQVREQLLQRISSGTWRPGQLIPNEFDLAREMGVSQGTARKALDSLAADGLLVRRQGRGTFVVEHTPSDMLFRFFNLFDGDGNPIGPGSTSARVQRSKATAAERKKLRLGANAEVIRISRIRTRDGVPFIAETLVLPASRFARLERLPSVPNTLYDHFQKYFGITVSRGDERVSAVLAGRRETKLLNVSKGAPLLKLDRLMYDLDGNVVEWRVSFCHLDNAYYGVSLR